MSTLTWTPTHSGGQTVNFNVTDAVGLQSVASFVVAPPLPLSLWGPGDTRETDNEIAAAVSGTFTANGATAAAAPSLDAYCPSPVVVTSQGADWHGLAGVIPGLTTMTLGQQVDVSVLIKRGSSGAKFRVGFIANAGDPELQSESILRRDAAGVWSQLATGLGEFSTPVVDEVVDASGDVFERIRATFTALDVSGQSVQMRVGPYSEVSGETVEVHRVGGAVTVKRAVVTAEIDQAAATINDELGTDITATVTLVDAGKPSITLGDTVQTWLLSGTAVATGTIATTEGQTVGYRAAWGDGTGNSGFVEAEPITVFGWLPRLWSIGDSREAGNVVNASAQAIFTGTAGGTVTAISSVDPYLPAPIRITATTNPWEGAQATILPAVVAGDVFDVAIVTKRGTSGIAMRVYLTINSQETRLDFNTNGTVSQFSSAAGSWNGSQTFTLEEGTDGQTYEVFRGRFTSSQAGSVLMRVTPGAAGTREVHRVGALITEPFVAPPAPPPGEYGTLLRSHPVSGLAGSFNDRWAWNAETRSGGYPYYDHITFSETDGQPTMRVNYLAGSHTLDHSKPRGGINLSQYFPGFAAYKEVMLEYQFMLKPNFEWRKGGKLPGLQGGAAGGGSSALDSWSLRFMWRGNTGPTGSLVVYAYYPDKPGTWGQDWPFATGLSNSTFAGVWHTLRQRVRVNDVGQSNAEIEVWLDGVKQTITGPAGATQTVNVRLRTTNAASPDCNSLSLSSFYGGADSSWAPLTDQWIDFRAFRIWRVA